ncbi:protein FAR1-RELATED SEQUENCE 5-like [Rhododendron vialii]|uniref:protein FAR1-RELATED SEQUENCE 5-like n=1 Tax=Rhododendron vialii TaxID=182163 RepID=UPI00265D703F|nr:protein FAR1-RELATED SEQUENCE 5-like [Rhododendron vialii]XP_058201083.1 protein FAR1-RELATED SEQUENCE 5-like [Rhododendron vialii]XP_058201084.1 protein FAR1-RELATED SEQUENCE 5-like [Rhododendron vialii]
MICTPFVGVNHHRKNVLFGCAFLSDETTASFVWLFNAFLESMDYKAPKIIFTDQDHAIANAVAQVFSNTQHRLCGWHISKNAAVNISSLYQQEGFRDALNFLLYHCDSEKFFKEKWKEMIDKWHCADNAWLLRLYTLRQKWALAFSRDVFSCNISSSQRSESTNNVFQHMARKTLALPEFMDHYGKNAKKMREVEVIKDFKCASGNPCISSRECAILKHACMVYTHKMFAKFQDEFTQTTSISVLRCMPNGAFQTYTMRRQGGNREYIVEFNPIDRSISCCCKRFESLGLLCCHVLRVLNLNDVNEIPEQYILKRWTKDVKQGYGMMERHANLTQDKCGNSAKTLRLNRLMRKSFALMNLCVNSEESTKIAEQNMDKTFEEVRIYNASLCGDTSDVGDTFIPVSNVPVMDPLRHRQKGQTNGRMKGALEKRRKRKTSGNVNDSNPIADFLLASNVMQPPRFATPNDLLSEYPHGYFTSMI